MAGIEFGMPCTQRAVLGYCDVVWDKKTIDVKEEMAGSFSVTIRCSFVGGDHQWVVTELYAQRLCFERSSMGRVRGGGRAWKQRNSFNSRSMGQREEQQKCFFNSVHSGRDLGLKGKEADNSAIANSKEN